MKFIKYILLTLSLILVIGSIAAQSIKKTYFHDVILGDNNLYILGSNSDGSKSKMIKFNTTNQETSEIPFKHSEYTVSFENTLYYNKDRVFFITKYKKSQLVTYDFKE